MHTVTHRVRQIASSALGRAGFLDCRTADTWRDESLL